MADPRQKEGFRDFADEMREMLEQMEQDLVRIGRGEKDPERLNSLFRSAHTIKGTSGMYDFHSISDFVHSLENVLDRVRSGQLELSELLIQAVLQCKDHLLKRLAMYEHGHYEDPQTLSEGDRLVEELTGAAGGIGVAKPTGQASTAKGEEVRDWAIHISCHPQLFANGLDPYPFFRYLAEHGTVNNLQLHDERIPALSELDATTCYLDFDLTFQTALPQSAIVAAFEFAKHDIDLSVTPLAGTGAVSTAAPEIRHEAETSTRDHEAHDHKSGRTIRVDADKLDLVVDNVGEAVVVASSIQQLSINLKNEFLEEMAHRLTVLLTDIRANSLKLRMVPVDTVFRRFTRVVYEMGLKLGKPARLEIHGGDTELDKNLIDHLTDPLTHMIRNALDHGIEETPEDRQQAGKAREAVISLVAYHRAGEIIIEVSDDGRGIDKDEVLKRAASCGLYKPGDAIKEEQIYRFLFEPGFSTSETVTELSGRGVGLDVVRKNVEALRGHIEIESQKGKGTLFRIILPLTLANIDGFLLRVGKNQYAIPLDMVNECMEFRSSDLVVGEQNYIRVRGKVMPFINMNEWFEETASSDERRNLVIVHAGNLQAGLVVDALLGRMHSVIKPLGDHFGDTHGVSGFAVLGDGSIALILDTNSLVADVKRRSEELAQENLEAELAVFADSN